MTPSPPSVFVCGVTGNQGGAVAKYLLQLNWTVHAVVRDLGSPAAVALAEAGVKLTEGDWDNKEALETSIAGCSKLFLNLVSTWEEFDRERRQAVSIVNIAKNAGVKQIVSSTSLGVSQYDLEVEKNLTDMFKPGSALHAITTATKSVEETVVNGGLDSYTLLRPGWFMNNLVEPLINDYSELLTKGTWSTVFSADTRLGLIDCDDIGKFAVAVMQDEKTFNGRAIGLVSEFLTPQETLDHLGEAMGRPGLEAIFVNEGEVEGMPYVTGHRCMEHLDEFVDMEELAAVIHLTSFKNFLEREKAKVKKL